ncbi:MAG: tRNA-dihydrouridine synthase, partial [Candidatus Margulisiibacteriota bacterium]
VIKKFSGAYLLQTPAILCRIIDRLAAALALPITVKLRIGYAKRDVDKIVGIARQCEQAGAQAIFVHGRTQAQLYSGGIDYASIKAIKENVKIPVIASGNIFSPQKAKEMLELTGSDGVWVARGALGNPWIFRQIKTFLTSGGLLREPSFAEKMEVLKRHLSYVDKYKLLPPRSKVGIGRKVALWYLKGFKHAAAVRAATCRIQTMDELFLLLDRIAKMPEVLA